MNVLYCGCLYSKRSELFMLPHRPTDILLVVGLLVNKIKGCIEGTQREHAVVFCRVYDLF